MNPQKKGAQALLDALDSIAQKHGATNPELLADISKHRADLQVVLHRSTKHEIAQTCLRVATWVKFIFDFF